MDTYVCHSIWLEFDSYIKEDKEDEKEMQEKYMTMRVSWICQQTVAKGGKEWEELEFNNLWLVDLNIMWDAFI